MKTVTSAISMALALGAGPSEAQVNGLTAAVVLAGADTLVGRLGDVVNTTGAASQAVVGQALTQINSLRQELARDARDQISAPLENLNTAAQNTAQMLNHMVLQTNELLDKQRRCFDDDLHLFLAALQTVIERSKLGIPFVSPGEPRLSHFVFAGGHSPNVIPLDGGIVTVFGFRLWGDLAPGVSIVDGAGSSTAVARLEPERKTDDEIIVRIPPTIIHENAGKCLLLRVDPKMRAGLLSRPRTPQPLVLPFCVPEDFQVQYAVSARHDYQCRIQQPSYEISSRAEVRNNDSCDQGALIRQDFGFDIPNGCVIIAARATKGDLNRGEIGSTNASFVGKTVTLTGQLDSAKCARFGPFGSHLIEHQTWHYGAIAVMQCTAYVSRAESWETGWQPATFPRTSLTLELPKSCLMDPAQSTAHVVVSRRVGRTQTTERVIYDGTGSTANVAPLQLTQSGVGLDSGTMAEAVYTLGVPAAPARVSVSVSSASCGY